jgi:hypothetical protein
MAERSSNGGLAVLGITLALGLVASSWLATATFRELREQGQTVEVKGFAERRITSDYASWRGRFTTRAADLTGAYATLERQREQVLAFLNARGVDGGALEISPVQTSVIYARNEKGRATNRIEGYALSLEIAYGDTDIDRVARVAQESADLVRQGIEFSSNRPQYFYLKLGELKIDLLGEATADARTRAEALARNSGAEIGAVRWARQGVFQITPAHSTEVSDYGRNDTSSREKSVKAVVTLRFSIS